MAKVTERQIVVMPNIDVNGVVELGNMTIIDSSAAPDWVPKTFLPAVTALANMYSTIEGPLYRVGLIVRTGDHKRIHPLTDEEHDELRWSIDALSYSTSARGTRNSFAHGNFDFTTWTFPADRKASESVNIRNRQFGFRIVDRRDHMLQIPPFVHHLTLSKGPIDRPLLDALLRCLHKKSPDDVRVMRAVNWLNQSRSLSDETSDYTRLMHIACAFETLLNTPRGATTQYFVRTIGFLLGETKELETWAKKFYDGRSDIVHGNNHPDLMYGTHKHNSYLELAKIVFRQCLYRKLGLMGYWAPNDEFARREGVQKFLVSNKERFKYLQKFRLTMSRKDTLKARTFLTTIQSNDITPTAQESLAVLESLIAVALDALRRLQRFNEFKNEDARKILKHYRQILLSARDHVANEQYPSLDGILYAARVPTTEDPWLDAHIRGKSVGDARLISLDSLIHGIRSASNLLTTIRVN